MVENDSTPISPVQDDEIDLGALLRSIWVGKYWLFLFATVAAGLSFFYLLVTPPTYQADALLQLEEKSGQLSLPAGLSNLVEDTPRSVTEMEIVRSRMVLGRVVADLNLDWRAGPRLMPVVGYGLTRVNIPLPDWAFLRPYATGAEIIRLDLLQVPPEWIGEAVVLTKQSDQKFDILLPDGSVTLAQVGQVFTQNTMGFALKIGRLEAKVGQQFIVRHISEASAIESLRQSISISEKGRQSGILQAVYKSPDPKAAQRNLQAIVQAYSMQNVSRSSAEAQSSLEFVEQQIPEAEAEVTEAEDELNAYRLSRKAVDLGLETENLLTQIGQLETEFSQLEVEEESISDRYTPNHPVYKRLLINKTHLEKRIEVLREEANGLPETQREVFDRTRDLEIAQGAYLQLLNRAQELRVLKASTIGNVRIIDGAQAKDKPIAPRKSRVLVLGTLIGLLFGAGFVLLRVAMHKGVQSSEQIEQLGIPVFATINRSVLEERSSHQRHERPILAVSQPTDLSVEAFRSLRTSLHFGMLDADSKSIVITSAAPDAGKSFTSVNLATVTAQSGKRVCLVDCDIRRGQLRKYFKVQKGRKGLAELLAGEIELSDARLDTEVEGLSFISTGVYPPNPSELLMRPSMAKLIADLDNDFDLVIFDTPPTLAVTDPIILARAAGTTLAVIRFDETAPGEIEALKRAFEVAGVQLTGAILNGFDPKKSKSGQYYEYNYRYAYEKRKE